MACPVTIFDKLVSHKLPFHMCDKRLLEDYYKFISLKVYTKDTHGLILSPTAEIDEIWHEHLLHNFDYIEMCTKINCLVFHWPEREKDSIQDKTLRRETFFEFYLKFFPTYKKTGDETVKDETVKCEVDELSQYIFTNLSPNAFTQIFVKTITGKSITIESDLEKDTLESLKKRVYIKWGIPLNSHRYVFLGKTMIDENKTLKEYGVEKDSQIHLNLNLKGC
jgi:hypothetical protein